MVKFIEKRVWVACALLVAAGYSMADDLTLKDGRVLKDATIKSETARKVIVLYEGGMTSVDKRLLPENLRRMYPETSESVTSRQPTGPARTTSTTQPETIGQLMKKKEKTVKEDKVPNKKTEAQIQWLVRKDAAHLAEMKFDEQEKGSSDYKRCKVQIESMQPVEGLVHVWIVSGQATMYRKAHYRVEHDTSPIGDAEWRNKRNGTEYAQPDSLPAESKVFEGRYAYNDDDTSTLEITRQ